MIIYRIIVFIFFSVVFSLPGQTELVDREKKYFSEKINDANITEILKDFRLVNAKTDQDSSKDFYNYFFLLELDQQKQVLNYIFKIKKGKISDLISIGSHANQHSSLKDEVLDFFIETPSAYDDIPTILLSRDANLAFFNYLSLIHYSKKYLNITHGQLYNYRKDIFDHPIEILSFTNSWTIISLTSYGLNYDRKINDEKIATPKVSEQNKTKENKNLDGQEKFALIKQKQYEITRITPEAQMKKIGIFIDSSVSMTIIGALRVFVDSFDQYIRAIYAEGKLGLKDEFYIRIICSSGLHIKPFKFTGKPRKQDFNKFIRKLEYIGDIYAKASFIYSAEGSDLDTSLQTLLDDPEIEDILIYSDLDLNDELAKGYLFNQVLPHAGKRISFRVPGDRNTTYHQKHYKKVKSLSTLYPHIDVQRFYIQEKISTDSTREKLFDLAKQRRALEQELEEK